MRATLYAICSCKIVGNIMGTMNFRRPRCSNCNQEIEESPHLQIDQRRACPSCGSAGRNQFADRNATLEPHGSLRGRGRHEGIRHWFVEILSGANFSHRLGKWVRKLRLIDRDGDNYEEEVIDPSTGEVIHKTKEKLSAHTGHGSAKKKTV